MTESVFKPVNSQDKYVQRFKKDYANVEGRWLISSVRKEVTVETTSANVLIDVSTEFSEYEMGSTISSDRFTLAGLELPPRTLVGQHKPEGVDLLLLQDDHFSPVTDLNALLIELGMVEHTVKSVEK